MYISKVSCSHRIFLVLVDVFRPCSTMGRDSHAIHS